MDRTKSAIQKLIVSNGGIITMDDFKTTVRNSTKFVLVYHHKPEYIMEQNNFIKDHGGYITSDVVSLKISDVPIPVVEIYFFMGVKISEPCVL